MTDETTVTITQKRLDELEKAEAKLQALQNGGVDNWEWYDDSMDSYREWLEERENAKKAEAPK